jgi:hypothetical protein
MITAAQVADLASVRAQLGQRLAVAKCERRAHYVLRLARARRAQRRAGRAAEAAHSRLIPH